VYQHVSGGCSLMAVRTAASGWLREALRLLPDLLQLLPRLAADRCLPRRVRVGLALLLAYFVFPLDLVPDSFRCWATPTMPSSWPLCFGGSRARQALRRFAAGGRAPMTGLLSCAV
jgi:hypothetical protein